MAQRHAFFRAFIQHVLVLPQFFDLAIYLPRVIRLATVCEDFSCLRKIIDSLQRLCKQVREQCDFDIKAYPKTGKLDAKKMLSDWKQHIFESIRENITAAFPPRLSKAGKQAWKTHMGDCDVIFQRSLSVKDCQIQQARLFSFDLAHIPFRCLGLPKEMVAQRGIPAKKTVFALCKAAKLLPDRVCKGVQILTQWIGFADLPHGLPFATRPFSVSELFILNRDAYAKSLQDSMRAVVLSVRGFKLGEKTPVFDRNNVLQVPGDDAPGTYNIIASSWKTRSKSWTASVMRRPDPDVDRYGRLCRLINGVIAQPKGSRYLIFPELALPAHWFIGIARKLHGCGISLITGIEYLHAKKSRVRNQVWVALSHNGLGFPSLMIYRQDKQQPALHEEQELQRLAGLKMVPDKTWKTPPIIQHGDLYFSI